jgi:hypothetical protein
MSINFPFRPQNKLKIPATFPKFTKSDKGTIYKNPYETPYSSCEKELVSGEKKTKGSPPLADRHRCAWAAQPQSHR